MDLFLYFFFGGILAAAICNELLLRFSTSLGIRNKNDVVIRWSNESKPSLGGVSFFVVFIFSSFAFSIISEDNIFHNSKFIALVIAGSISFAMGLADDAYNTRPYAKLVVQILCGIILLFAKVQINIFHHHIFDGLLTIFWVVAIMNSLNMLDNMDGITGTTVLFILLSCLSIYFYKNGFVIDVWSISMLSILGGILGFLKYNINPSKLFMGDAGSQFIGLFVSFFSIEELWSVGHSEIHLNCNWWFSIIVVLTAFTPAAADTLTVVINRLKRGQSPMVGGKDHTTHHLVYAGFKDRQVWYIFLVLGVLSFFISLFEVFFFSNYNNYLLIFFVLYFIVVFSYLYRNTIKFKSK